VITLRELRTNWQPATWEDVRSTWFDLVPESRDVLHARIRRRFRGRAVTPQQAGWVFEEWLLKTLQFVGYSGHPSYQVKPIVASPGPLEEVDGLIFEGFQGFLIEAKFLPKGVDFGPIAQLHVCVAQRPSGTLSNSAELI
jgi:hypothetical protein